MNNQLTHPPSHCYQTCLNRQTVNSLWSAIQNSSHQIVESKFLLYIVRNVFCDTGRLAWADPNPIKAFFAKFLQSPQVQCLYPLRFDAYICSGPMIISTQVQCLYPVVVVARITALLHFLVLRCLLHYKLRILRESCYGGIKWMGILLCQRNGCHIGVVWSNISCRGKVWMHWKSAAKLILQTSCFLELHLGRSPCCPSSATTADQFSTATFHRGIGRSYAGLVRAGQSLWSNTAFPRMRLSQT